jgi:CRISPR-associated protein Cmr1
MFYISRFKDMEKREYECEVVTPLFLGGADPRKADLRVASIKGAMRFWWRAQYDGDDVKKMAKKEGDIFGSTERKAVVSIRLSVDLTTPVLKDLPPGKMEPVKGKTYKTSIIKYLGYGFIENNKYSKEHFESGCRFKIIFTFPNHVENDVFKAFSALVTFGGLGARSRNGFGSLHCDGVVDHTLKKEGTLKSFTAFSQGAILFNQFRIHNRWEDALSEIGVVYREARLKLEPLHKWNKRAFIALPIEAQRENIPSQIKSGRHAKPYFLHVNKTPEGKYQGHILFLPYLYKTGSDDKAKRLKEYSEVCEKMNDEIRKGMGGKI